MTEQPDLFAPEAPPDNDTAIPGLAAFAGVVTAAEQARLTARIDAAPLEPFRFGQWTGKRLTAHYGSAYDYARGAVTPAPPLPDWLLALRERVCAAAGRDPAAFVQALLIRYDPGAGIGWHRDRPQYAEVLGLSLGAPATLRLRRRASDGHFERHTHPLTPGAAYLLTGEARGAWEHSITPLDQTRWSVTFRSLV